ncbi:MAG: GDP-mannose 4,6-dehydratase [Acidimicrobiales bacterium]
MRAYVTGGSGFVGGWLRAHLEDHGDEVLLAGDELDVTDGDAISADIVAAAPEVVYHLAALADVARSWEDPVRTFEVNAVGTLRVLEAARRCSLPPVVIVVSSAEVYGRTVGTEPLREQSELRPVSPYAASKVAAEYLAMQAWLGRGVRAVRVRPFNHVGAGQSAEFVVSALARRVAQAELAGGGVVPVGNLGAARDFSDVRDVVRAYRLLAEAALSDETVAGEAYNVATGRATTVEEVAQRLCALVDTPVELVVDPALFRPVDVPVLFGDASRLRSVTGWEPQVPLDDTLADLLGYWRAEETKHRP